MRNASAYPFRRDVDWRRAMKQYGRFALGVLIAVVMLALGYAELKADAALTAELGVETESNILQVRYAE